VGFLISLPALVCNCGRVVHDPFSLFGDFAETLLDCALVLIGDLRPAVAGLEQVVPDRERLSKAELS